MNIITFRLLQKSSGESGRASNEDTKSSKNHGVEPSQGDFITYDDPVGRIERARILAQLKAASPSQDVEREFEPIPPADSTCDADKENEVSHYVDLFFVRVREQFSLSPTLTPASHNKKTGV